VDDARRFKGRFNKKHKSSILILLNRYCIWSW
jgi:hypothetical protein